MWTEFFFSLHSEDGQNLNTYLQAEVSPLRERGADAAAARRLGLQLGPVPVEPQHGQEGPLRHRPEAVLGGRCQLRLPPQVARADQDRLRRIRVSCWRMRHLKLLARDIYLFV